MHEISLCESILDILTEQAGREHFTRVKRVSLEIGPLSCVEPEALRFGFDAVMRGSIAEGAVLEIATPEATATCPACQQTVQVASRYDACPECGALALHIETGDELRIRELEVV